MKVFLQMFSLSCTLSFYNVLDEFGELLPSSQKINNETVVNK